MSSQFVDIDADGYQDILVGSFSGTPYLIRGSAEGYLDPVQLVDANGDRLLISDFWNDAEGKWDSTDRAGSAGHCTSVAAVDWTGNGVLDLLLGDYYGGRLYLCKNEGTSTEPKFALRNEPVMVGGEPVVVPKGLSAPRIVDFNGDGLFDIVLGGAKGGLYYLQNVGSPGQPKFAQMVALIDAVGSDEFIAVVPASDGKPLFPGSSWHVEFADYDGDGKLDLLVGARAAWKEHRKIELTENEVAERDRLKVTIDETAEKYKKTRQEYFQLAQQSEAKEEIDEKVTAEMRAASDQFRKLANQLAKLKEEFEKYETELARSGDLVWLFKRK